MWRRRVCSDESEHAKPAMAWLDTVLPGWRVDQRGKAVMERFAPEREAKVEEVQAFFKQHGRFPSNGKNSSQKVDDAYWQVCPIELLCKSYILCRILSSEQ